MMEKAYFVLKEKMQNEISDKIDDDYMRIIIENTSVHQIEKGEVLLREGGKDRSVFFIVEGSFIRYVDTPTGEVKIIMPHHNHFQYFMTCPDSFMHAKPVNCNIVANEKSTIILLNYNFIKDSLRDSKFIRKYYLANIEDLYMLNETLRSMRLTLTSEEYLTWLYRQFPDLFQRFSSYHIANFVGITPVWMSNLKKKMNF